MTLAVQVTDDHALARDAFRRPPPPTRGPSAAGVDGRTQAAGHPTEGTT